MSANAPIIFTAVDATAQAFNSVRGRLNSLGESVVSVRGLIGALTAAFGVGTFAAGIKSAAEAADAAAKMGDRFGIATQTVVGLKHAAELAGASQQAVATGMRQMADLAYKAASGNAEAKRTLELLNIDAERFIRMPMDQQFNTIIDALHKTENATLRNALARESLGKGAGELMGLVAEGSDAIRQATKDTEAWGLALSRIDAAKIELANDAVTRAKAAVQGIFTQIALQASPAIKAIADAFSDAAAESRGFRDHVESGMRSIVSAVGYVANVIQGLRFAWEAAKFAVATFAEFATLAIGKAANALLGAIQLMTQGLGLLANVVYGTRFAWVALTVVVAEFADFAVRALASVAQSVSESKIAEWAQHLPGPLGLAARAIRATAISATDTLNSFGESTRNTADALKANLDRIANEGLPKDKMVAAVAELRAEVTAFFGDVSTSFGNVAADIKANMDAIAEQGLPRDKIIAAFDQMKALIDEKAKEIAEQRAKFNSETVGELPQLHDDTKFRQDLAQRMAAIMESNMHELTVIEHQYTQKQNVLDIALEKKLLTEQEHEYQSLLLKQKMEQEKTKIEDAEYKKRWGIANVYRQLDLNSAAFFLSQMANMMQSKNRQMFEIGKAAAIGETVIQTYRAAQGAYAALAPIPIVGPALGIAAAAAAIVSGMARVQSIRSQSFGSTGGATPTFDASPNTGLPTINTPSQPEPPQLSTAQGVQQATPARNITLNLSFQGSGRYTQEEIRDALIPALNEALGDGANLQVNQS